MIGTTLEHDSKTVSTLKLVSNSYIKSVKLGKAKFLTAFLLLFNGNVMADVMIGASLPNDGFSKEVIQEFNNQSPKDLAFINVYSAFSHDWDNLYWQSSNVVAEGAMPMISWMPIDLSRPDDNLLPEIAIGLWDDYIDQWGIKLLAWVNSYPEAQRPRLAIRFAHEFNGNWYPYSNTPVYYQEAWQHIHKMFDRLGVNEHVDWIWSISRTSYDEHNNVTLYYPGNKYVDWTAIDGYNWGSNYVSNGWTSFKDVFSEAYATMVSNYPSKPIMISETASAEPLDLPNPNYGMYGDDSDAFESKSAWMGDMLQDIESEFPAVRALALFNINKELSWSINGVTNTGMDAWIDGTQSEYYTSSFLVASDFKRQKRRSVRNRNNRTDESISQYSIELLTSDYSYNTATQETRNINSNVQIQLAKQRANTRGNSRSAQADRIPFAELSLEELSEFRRAKYSIIDY